MNSLNYVHEQVTKHSRQARNSTVLTIKIRKDGKAGHIWINDNIANNPVSASRFAIQMVEDFLLEA